MPTELPVAPPVAPSALPRARLALVAVGVLVAGLLALPSSSRSGAPADAAVLSAP